MTEYVNQSINGWKTEIGVSVCNSPDSRILLDRLVNVIVKVDVARGSLLPNEPSRELLNSYRVQLGNVVERANSSTFEDLYRALECKQKSIFELK
jgi:hypothetical protein